MGRKTGNGVKKAMVGMTEVKVKQNRKKKGIKTQKQQGGGEKYWKYRDWGTNHLQTNLKRGQLRQHKSSGT